MPYGTIKVDTITFTAGGVDTSVSISGLVQNPTFTGNITSTGTISGNIIQGGTIVSGTTVTGNAGQFTVVTGNTAGFTTVTGTTVTGTTANFTTLSGTTVTGNAGSFTTVTGGVTTITSGVFAAGTEALPSISFSSDPNTGIFSPGADQVAISTNGTERARIDSSGRLLVGTSTSSAASKFIVQGNVSGGNYAQMDIAFNSAASTVGANTTIGVLRFTDQGGGNELANITCATDAACGTNDYPGRLVFSTTADGAASPTQRLLISNGGNAYFGTGSVGQTGLTIYAPGLTSRLYFNRGATSSTSTALEFADGGTTQGSITYTNTATAYNTSSDYRLKENVIALSDGITRLQQLKPSRFNFIADPAKTVDGFLAHEVQDVVPEAITGEKDAVDDDGNPQYQGIDQSKLVPLLTAALQEAIGEIESLKARVAALESA